MKPLKIIGVFFFFIHYYLTIALATLLNVVKYFWKVVTQTALEKHCISPYQATHSYVFASIHEVIAHDGFQIDTHEFQTSDGASVHLWRLRQLEAKVTKPYPIVMMHGLLDCSASWFLHVDKSKSLPYMLAKLGFDVWIGNNRGNRISKDENNNDADYWAYNFDHLVQYDQPAIINGVLKETGKDKIIYLGHSQGSTQFLLGLGVHRELSSKIATFIGLGTVVSLQNVEQHFVLKLLSRFYLLQLCNFIGFNKILVLPKVLSKAVGVLIYNSRIHFEIMMKFIRMLCGYSLRNKIPTELFGVIITHEPGGASANNALHWVQCYRLGGTMKKFDFGKQKNQELYGSHVPPEYCLKHLDQLPFNTYLFKGLKDAVMSDRDFIQLIARFDQGKIFTYDLPDYNHLDYVWSETAHKDLYEHILEISQSVK